ncbi:MAG: S41 family peptidase [Dehalococcoidia bacterium]
MTLGSRRFLTTVILPLSFLAVLLAGCVLATPPATPTPPAEVPQELSGVWEVWQVLSQEHLQGEGLDADKLELGAIREMLEALGDPDAAETIRQQYQLQQDGPGAELSGIWEVWRLLAQASPQQATQDAEELEAGAIRGMLEALGDPYASYLTRQQYMLEQGDLAGSFHGIGAEVTIRDGRLTIVAPLPDTPAERAGILPGDVILEVDGEDAEGLSLLDSVLKIRGAEGTPVTLLVQRQGQPEPFRVAIVRELIQITTVFWEMLPDQMAHLKLRSFARTTDEELAQALREIDQQGGKAIVLDLRNNPGGLLDATVRATSQFLEDGLVVYEIDGRGERRDWVVQRRGLARDIPLVVLVNQFSASGSEVLAGALQDHHRAVLVGTQTFGKGSVNTFRELQDGSAVYFTIARWYTPNGTLIEGEGILPDILVEMPPDSPEDPQLLRAVDYLESTIAVGVP